MSSFSISHCLIMGESRDCLTQGDLSVKSVILKCNYSEAYNVLNVSSSSGKGGGLGSAAISRHFWAVQRFTYDVIGQ